ncbi:MAG: hypothetical protein ACK559_17285, partial [bacterium]
MSAGLVGEALDPGQRCGDGREVEPPGRCRARHQAQILQQEAADAGFRHRGGQRRIGLPPGKPGMQRQRLHGGDQGPKPGWIGDRGDIGD